MHFDEWQRRLTPITCEEASRIVQRGFSGRTIAVRAHLVGDAVPVFGSFAKAGARVVVCPCNPESTNPAVVDGLLGLGVEVHGGPGMTPSEDAAALRSTAEAATDVVMDMGGELIEAAIQAGLRPRAALEATGSGILRIEREARLPFPVFNWDDIALKDGLHNRYHVGATAWPTFEQITSMNLFGRRVAVIGHGPVGRGLAERAKALGGVVSVVDLDPVRQLEALHAGYEVVELASALPAADIVVTATGRPGVISPAQLSSLKDGAVVFNCGHGNREIDIEWLAGHGRRQVRPLIEAFDLPKGTIYLLNKGNLLNLAPGTSPFGVDLFDPFAAVMILGMEWLLDGNADGFAPGLHPYPKDLERQAAEKAWACLRR